ncbi:MAG: hypothetical protein AAGF79_12485 [Pseudomonadota bacterium]
MSLSLRPVEPADVPAVAPVLVAEAQRRAGLNGRLWAVSAVAAQRTETALRAALDAGHPVRQFWQLAEVAGQLGGLGHAMRLPVPPIYKGAFGAPGLILADSLVTAQAPPETAAALMGALEADLRSDGAELIVAAALPGGPWHGAIGSAGYKDLTLYYSKHLDAPVPAPATVRPAGPQDIAGIVSASARNRAILEALNPFWDRHPEADARFESWMCKSLTLSDRDMMVPRVGGQRTGYAIAQPAGPLHVPPAHESAHIGFLDDFYHDAFADPEALSADSSDARDLLTAAESAFVARGYKTTLVVCPDAWSSKRTLLETAGYAPALIWGKKDG